MQLRRRSNGASVLLGPVLGKGGEGAVFPVRGAPDLVAKIYTKAPALAKVEKLIAMALVRSPALLRIAAWPVDLLIDDKQVVRGFLMPRVTSRADVHELYSPKSRRTTFPEADFRFVVRAATNIARAFATVHAQGHVLGDVNHGNAPIGRDGTVRLIDCDSFQIRGSGKVFTCDVGVPLFTPPELQGRVFRGLRRTANHDSFGLAVLLFHLLFSGRHPYAGRYSGGEMPIERAIAESRFAYGERAASAGMSAPPGTLPLGAFGSRIAELFERAFAKPGEGVSRPSALEWIDRLEELENGLDACAHSPLHFHPRWLACCWCELEAGTGVRLFGRQSLVTELLSPERLDALWREITSIARPERVGPLDASDFPELAPSKRPASFGSRVRTFVSAVLVFLGILGVFSGHGPLLFNGSVTLAVVALVHAPRLWLFLSPKARAEVRRAEQRWSQLVESWKQDCSPEGFDRIRQQLEEVRDLLADLPRKKMERLDRIDSDMRGQRHSYLSGFRLADATFRSVPPAKVARLSVHGADTAADVPRMQLTLHHIVGKEAADELIAWHKKLDNAFVFKPADPQDAALLAKVEREMRAREEHLLASLRDGPKLLSEKKQEIMASRVAIRTRARSAHAALVAARRRAGLET